MSIELILILIFIIVLAIISFLYRNSTLDKVILSEDEVILFEEAKVKILQGGSPRTVQFNNCIIRVTDRRIIVAQKILMSRKYVLRHIINYGIRMKDTDLPETFRKGYIHMTINKSDVKINRQKEHTTISIDIPESTLTRGQFIEFETADREIWERNFL